jgi:DNA excision repair protein ERCC-3
LKLICADAPLLEELVRQPKVRALLGERLDARSFAVDSGFRGVLKLALINVGYPAEDVAGYVEGQPLPIQLRSVARSGLPFHVRDYQKESAAVYFAGGHARGGSGVIVLPCGAGKTIVGIAAMAMVQRSTLVLTTSITAVKQWRREILDKTDLNDDQVAEYTGESRRSARSRWRPTRSSRYRPDKDPRTFPTSRSSRSATGA